MPETNEPTMNIQVSSEILAPCKRLLKVEVPTVEVEEEFNRVTTEYTRYARLPGFRPGKVPRAIVEKRFTTEIENEVQRSIVPKAFRDAITKQSIKPVGYPDIKDIQFGRGKPLAFTAELEVEPDFPLPDYKNIPVKKPVVTVTDEDVEKALKAIAEQRAELEEVTGRALAMDDFAVVNFTATIDGKPLAELAPDAKALGERQNLLLMMSAQSFVPGFCEKLVGAAIGDKRQVEVEFPADFQIAPLVGKKATYAVELVGIKSKKLPVLDDAFAASFHKDLNLAKMKEQLQGDLQREKERNQTTEAKNQIVEYLLARSTFDLPPGMLADETRSVIQSMVSENANRGVSREAILEKKDEIYQFANQNAADRLKVNFILRRIGQQEKITVTQPEIQRRLAQLATRYNIPYPKLRSQLEERGGMADVIDEILVGKVLEFLFSNASVTN